LLQRHAPQVILLYDSDDAGLRATFRAGDELLRHKVRVSVATLPEGEDPDTLVQRGGAAALEQVLKDAIDVFDRKIQILDRKAFFGSLSGRRRALDRLLPTIRATADSITRELYLTRGAEAAGVRKETLAQELAALGAASRPALSVSTGVDHVDAPSNAEKTLLFVMLQDDEWRARVLDVVDAENFQSPLYRRVFEALAEGRPDHLDEMSARVLESLQAEALGPRSVDTMFGTAVDWIEADRITREMKRIKGEIPLLSGEEQVRRVQELRSLTAQRNAKRPMFGIVDTARRKGAPGT
jgi:DNA primase